MSSPSTHIDLRRVHETPIRVFHLTWLAFFLCFFSWFAIAPLMPVIRDEFGLSADQIANLNIAAVAVTILVRLIIGPLCDRFGPRRTYAALMALGALPVLGVATAQSYEAFLVFRLLIGAIGASFVITQVHTSVMFAPNVVGTANAAAAGWGNAGGGAAQALMPLLLGALLMLGVEQSLGWRLALLVPGIGLLVMAAVYWRWADDSPSGKQTAEGRPTSLARAAGEGGTIGGADGGVRAHPTMHSATSKKGGWASFRRAAGNYRAWLLSAVYGACFGIEIFIHVSAAIYFVDRYDLGVAGAGFAVGAFGGLALFARALGGWVSDRQSRRGGLPARSQVLFVLLIAEGLGLLWFANAPSVGLAVAALLLFGLFTHMACGATYALVPFIDRQALGGVAGIVGAGGNIGAVCAGLLLKFTGGLEQTLPILGLAVLVVALAALAIRFSPEHRAREQALLDEALTRRAATAGKALALNKEAGVVMNKIEVQA